MSADQIKVEIIDHSSMCIFDGIDEVVFNLDEITWLNTLLQRGIVHGTTYIASFEPDLYVTLDYSRRDGNLHLTRKIKGKNGILESKHTRSEPEVLMFYTEFSKFRCNDDELVARFPCEIDTLTKLVHDKLSLLKSIPEYGSGTWEY